MIYIASPAPLLLRHAADPNALDNAGESPLGVATAVRSPGVCRALLEARAEVDQLSPGDGMTPLTGAA